MAKFSTMEYEKEGIMCIISACIDSQLWRTALPFDSLKYFIPLTPILLFQYLTHLPLDKMAAILADNNLKCIFFNENYGILIRISP